MSLRLLLLPKQHRDFGAATRRRLGSSPVHQSRLHLEVVQRVWAEAIIDLPYYRDLVVFGRAPAKILSWEDFSHIPVLTRQDLQDQPASFVRTSRQPHHYMKTAGSTGTPLHLAMDNAERDLMRVVKLAEWQEFGYTPRSRLFLIWGHSHLLGTGWRRRLNHLKRKLADRMLGYRRVDAYRLNRASCRRYAAQLIRFRPLGLVGYASALDLFARYTSEFRNQYRSLGLRFVLATSEPPPRADTVSVLEDLFACPVVQEYGGAEFGQVAFKRGNTPFDVYADLNYVECEIPTTEEPDAYSVLVTSLYPNVTEIRNREAGSNFSGNHVIVIESANSIC